MRIIAGAIRNPVAIGVTVLLISLFGILSLRHLPLQLFPDIERPTIAIFTNWRGASPEEVEAELLEPQEQVLQGLPGVEEVNGNANSGGSQVFLTFAIGYPVGLLANYTMPRGAWHHYRERTWTDATLSVVPRAGGWTLSVVGAF